MDNIDTGVKHMQSSITAGGRERVDRLSANLFILAAFASFLFSVALWFSGNEMEGIFVGIWVPSILSFGALVRADRSHR
jgi:hypothetical protein